MPVFQRTYFHLNYGGPGDQTAHTVKAGQDLWDACKQHYCTNLCSDWVNQKTFEIKGVIVTVYTHGIHRSLSLALPPNPSKETIAAFNCAKAEAEKFCDKNYYLLANNCATAVSHTLRELDKNITSPVVLPWDLDKQIDKYIASQDIKNNADMVKQFINRYKEISDKESFSFFRRGQKHWDNKTIRSTSEILDHAYTKKGERSMAALLEEKWVVKDKGFLRPGPNAPDIFRSGLERYNESYEKLIKLKAFYKEHAGFIAHHTSNIFKDNPNYETAMNRLRTEAIKNPKGTAAKVLKSIAEEKPDFSKVKMTQLSEKENTITPDVSEHLSPNPK